MIEERTDRRPEGWDRGPVFRTASRTRPEEEPRPSGFRSAALVVNTRSRQGRTSAATAPDYLQLLGVPVAAVHFVDDPSRLAETVWEALSDSHDLIVLGGGDGSVSTVAHLLAHADATLGLLPLGTANDFARTLGIPSGLEEACKTVARGVAVAADLGSAGGVHFVNVASMGLGGAAAEEISPRLKRAAGALAYPLAALRAYRNCKPFEAGLVFPGGDHEPVAMGGLVHVAIGNGRYYGGGMIVAPGSAVDDHALDVYAIEATDPLRLGRIALGLKTGEFVSSERVHHWRTMELDVITHPRLPVNLDGELARKTPVSFSVVPDALRVLVPPSPPPREDPIFSSMEVAARA